MVPELFSESSVSLLMRASRTHVRESFPHKLASLRGQGPKAPPSMVHLKHALSHGCNAGYGDMALGMSRMCELALLCLDPLL